MCFKWTFTLVLLPAGNQPQSKCHLGPGVGQVGNFPFTPRTQRAWGLLSCRWNQGKQPGSSAPKQKRERTVDQGEDFPASNTSCDAGSTCKTLRKAVCFRLHATASSFGKRTGWERNFQLSLQQEHLMAWWHLVQKVIAVLASGSDWLRFDVPLDCFHKATSNSLQSRVLQHTRLPCPSLPPGV